MTGGGVGTYEFRLPMHGESDAVERFRGQLLEQLLDRPELLWQRVAACTDGAIYAALRIDGPMHGAARVLTDALNATAPLVPGARYAGA